MESERKTYKGKKRVQGEMGEESGAGENGKKNKQRKLEKPLSITSILSSSSPPWSETHDIEKCDKCGDFFNHEKCRDKICHHCFKRMNPDIEVIDSIVEAAIDKKFPPADCSIDYYAPYESGDEDWELAERDVLSDMEWEHIAKNQDGKKVFAVLYTGNDGDDEGATIHFIMGYNPTSEHVTAWSYNYHSYGTDESLYQASFVPDTTRRSEVLYRRVRQLEREPELTLQEAVKWFNKKHGFPGCCCEEALRRRLAKEPDLEDARVFRCEECDKIFVSWYDDDELCELCKDCHEKRKTATKTNTE